MQPSNSSMPLKIQQMALIGLMTAINCVIAPFSLPLPFSPIPISLCTLAIYFTVMVLGGKMGTASVALYILLGLVGLPVLSGFTGGAGKLLGPTGGYIIGYVFLAIICGIFADKSHGKILPCIFGMLLGTVVCYAFGTLWFAYQSHVTPTTAFATAVLPFIPADLAKMATAAFLGKQVRGRLMKAGVL